MFRLLLCEYIKLKRSKFLLIGGFGTLFVPIFVFGKAVMNYMSDTGTVISLFTIYDSAQMFLMLIFAPFILTIIGVWIISREYADGTLKNILVIPVSQTAFLCGKMVFFAILTLLFMLISWLEILVLAFLCNCFIPVTELTLPSFLYFLIKMLFGGILLYAVETPFLYLTVRTKGFAAPLIANAVVIFINILMSNSQIAGYYPWSASYLIVNGRLAALHCPEGISISIILILCLLGIAASLYRFKREEVR